MMTHMAAKTPLYMADWLTSSAEHRKKTDDLGNPGSGTNWAVSDLGI
jgi:hypothetical protein